MEGLPLHLQSRIYVEAGVSRICTTSRDEVLRAALLADQRDLDTPFTDGEDGPTAHHTWRVASMLQASFETKAQAVAHLQRIGRRLQAFRHVSIDVTGCSQGPHSTTPCLNAFALHVAPLLTTATRLTIRGLPGAFLSKRPASTTPLAAQVWRPLSSSPLGAACTRLDITSGPGTIAHLLAGLSTAFAAVRDARVRVDPAATADALSHPLFAQPDFMVVAPPSLTRLLVLLSPACVRDGRVTLCMFQADGLQDVVCRVVHPRPPPTPSAATMVAGVGHQRRALQATEAAAAAAVPQSSHQCLLFTCRAPALCTLRGFCRAAPAAQPRMLALRHYEVAFVRTQSHAAGGADLSAAPNAGWCATADVRAWLLTITPAVAPSLETMHLKVSPGLRQGEAVQLLAWAAVTLCFCLGLSSPWDLWGAEGEEGVRPEVAQALGALRLVV